MARGKAVGRYRPTRAGQKGGADTNRWLGTYGDAVTLLMAFFVMLYAMSQIDQVKFEAFVSGLEVPFGNPAIREGLLDASSGIVADAMVDVPDPNVIPEPPTVGQVVPAPHADASPPASKPAVDLDQLRQVRDAVQGSLDRQSLDHLAELQLDERGLVVNIAADDILFDTGSTRISGLGRRIIAAVAGPLGRFPNDVLVEGHTDDVPLQRAGYSNWNLSTDRAVAVLSMLADDFAIGSHRLGAVGYGEFRPRVPNDSDHNRSRNRRVDILVAAQGV